MGEVPQAGHRDGHHQIRQVGDNRARARQPFAYRTRANRSLTVRAQTALGLRSPERCSVLSYHRRSLFSVIRLSFGSMGFFPSRKREIGFFLERNTFNWLFLTYVYRT